MAEIRINPDQVDQTGGQFASKRGELDSLIQQANQLMNNLQGAFTGTRATAIFNDWAGMQPSLKNVCDVLTQASDLLKRAATDFRTADSAK